MIPLPSLRRGQIAFAIFFYIYRDGGAMPGDRWSREIELQKTFGLSPTESRYATCRENGWSCWRIASDLGVSVKTVRSLLGRADAKMTKKGEQTLIILKGDADREGTAVKQRAIYNVLLFVSKVLGRPVYRGTKVYAITLPKSDGDAQWLKDNVFRYIDIVGASSDAESEATANRLEAMYNDKNGNGPQRVGISILRRYLDDMYMQYDVWSD